jgi:hypothetical protein
VYGPPLIVILSISFPLEKELRILVGVKSLPSVINNRFSAQRVSFNKSGMVQTEFISAAKFFLLVPLCPVIGYFLLDQTGFSGFLVRQGLIPHAILGEGFGHVGLCFSVHYVFNGVKALIKGLNSLLR